NLDKNMFKGVPSNSVISLHINGNEIQNIPDGIFDNHTFYQIFFYHNPLISIPKNLCNNCSITSFFIDCFYLDFEIVENILNMGRRESSSNIWHTLSL